MRIKTLIFVQWLTYTCIATVPNLPRDNLLWLQQ